MELAHSSHRTQGFTLVEVLVGLVLTAFLLLGMVEVFSASQTAYRASTGISRNQENSRFAIDQLSRDLRMVGNMGCASDVSHLPVMIDGVLVSNGKEFYNHFDLSDGFEASRRFDISIQGYEATLPTSTAPGGAFQLSATPGDAASVGVNTDWLPNVNSGLFGDLSPTPIKGSDILVLRFFGADGVPITSISDLSGVSGTPTMAVAVPDSPQIKTAASGLPNYGLYGVANCTIASTFQVTSVVPSTGSFSIALTDYNKVGFNGMEATYQPGGTYIYPAFIMAYYVGVRSGSTVPSLYRARLNVATHLWQSEELVEGVEMMQLTYGRDYDDPAVTNDGALDGGIEDFITADNVYYDGTSKATSEPSGKATYDGAGTWLRVNAVRLSLLLRSPQSASTKDVAAGTFQVGGVTVTPPPGQGVLRSPYDVTVSFRNRVSGTY